MTYGTADYYKPGDYNMICDVSGRKVKASKMKRRWDNAMVHPDHWETRQPQDFVRGVKDDQSVPVSRPAATYDTTIIAPGVPSQANP